MSDRLSISVPIMVGDRPPPERVTRAAAAGYRVIESWWPWPDPVPAVADRAAFVDAFRRTGTRLHLLNLTFGPPGAGGRGIAGRAGDDDGFAAHAAAVVALAAELGARWIHALAGNATPGGRAVLGRRVPALAALAEPHGIGVVLEPLNRDDHPDYLLDPHEVPDVVRELGVNLLADVYHLARTGIDPVAYVTEHADLIGHVQIADFPGRGRPGSGGIAFRRVLDALDASGYTGLIGLEHLPDGPIPSPAASWRALRGKAS